MAIPPPLYYLANFRVLIDHARRTYADLLSADEAHFIAAFEALSLSAQCLYVRLLTRRGPLIRADKLHYPEIADIDAAALELQRGGLLDIDGPAPATTLLALLTLPQLQPLARSVGVDKSALKPNLIAAIAEIGDEAVGLLLRQQTHWYEALALTSVDTLSLLFFGNRRQDLSTFVVTELGHLQFERYALDEMRQFTDRADFDGYRAWLDIGDAIHEAVDANDIAQASTASQWCMTQPPHRLMQSRRDRLLARLADFFARQNCHELALALADATVDSPAARHRARLIRQRLGITDSNAIADSNGPPTNRRRVRARPMPVDERHLHFPAWQAGAAEQLVLTTLCATGYRGAHLENHFPGALFGLLCWDIVFMAKPGAFFNPYQLGPIDLFTKEFCPRRAVELAARLAEIRDPHEDWRQRLACTYAAKQGIANHFVAWRDLDVSQFVALCQALDSSLAAAICARMASNPRHYRRGFPDLALLSPSGELQFCEVKSPNDQLSAEQRDWLTFLRAQGSEAWVARIVVPATVRRDGSPNT